MFLSTIGTAAYRATAVVLGGTRMTTAHVIAARSVFAVTAHGCATTALAPYAWIAQAFATAAYSGFAMAVSRLTRAPGSLSATNARKPRNSKTKTRNH